MVRGGLRGPAGVGPGLPALPPCSIFGCSSWPGAVKITAAAVRPRSLHPTSLRPAEPARPGHFPDKDLIMPDIKILNPDALGKPLGQYSHMTRVKASEFLFIAGQVATDRDGKLVGADDFDAQSVQTFANIEAALRAAGAAFANVVHFTTYLL